MYAALDELVGLHLQGAVQFQFNGGTIRFRRRTRTYDASHPRGAYYM